MAELPGQCYIDKIISLDAFQKLTVSCSSQKEFILKGKDLTCSINPSKIFFFLFNNTQAPPTFIVRNSMSPGFGSLPAR